MLSGQHKLPYNLRATVPFHRGIACLLVHIIALQFLRNVTVTVILLIGALLLFVRLILKETQNIQQQV